MKVNFLSTFTYTCAGMFGNNLEAGGTAVFAIGLLVVGEMLLQLKNKS